MKEYYTLEYLNTGYIEKCIENGTMELVYKNNSTGIYKILDYNISKPYISYHYKTIDDITNYISMRNRIKPDKNWDIDLKLLNNFKIIKRSEKINSILR